MYKNVVYELARLGIIAAVTLFSFTLHAASSVTLAWDASPSPNIAGYTVRYGTASGIYPLSHIAGTTLTTTVSTLTAGTKYYFVVTARSSSGLESDPSNEISFTPPVTPLPNVLPTLNAISNVTISEEAAQQTVPLAGITVGIGDLPQLLTVTATSSNPGLIPVPAVTYTSPNATGTLRFTPAASASGTATITVTLNDGGLLNNLLSRTFTVTVNSVNDAPTLNTLGNLTLAPSAGQQTVSLSGIGTGAANESQALTVTAASSNPGLIPTPTVTYASPGATGTLRFTPATGASGTATITVTVNDGQPQNNTVSRSFTVTVSNPVNTPPTLSPLGNLTFNEDAAQQTINLSGIAAGAAGETQTLTVTTTSSNPGLIPIPAISYTSPNATGTLRFTPAASASGTATITVTVNDGQSLNNTVSRSFTATVNAVNDAPTLNVLNNLSLAINAARQTISLASITSGAANENQTLAVTATSSNPGLVPTPEISYTSPSTTGSLSFTPTAGTTGAATITVTVNDGRSQNNTVTLSFVVTVSGTSTQSIYVEAESGTRTSPMTVASDTRAANGQYVYSPIAKQGTIAFPLNISQAGNYWVWCRVLSPDSFRGSFFVRMDDGAEERYNTTPSTWSREWQWTRVKVFGSPRIYNLSQGAHTIAFRCREARTSLDALYITSDPNFVPPSIASLALTAGSVMASGAGESVLPAHNDSTAPVVSELEVIRADARTITLGWRTDEPALCHVDYGVAVPLDERSQSETNYSTEHSVSLTRIQQGTAYLIRVQSIDSAGNLSLTENGKATTPSETILAWAAEAGKLDRPLEAWANAWSMGGAYISSPVDGQGSALFPLQVEVASDYTLWCRVWPPYRGAGSFRVALDGGDGVVFRVDGSGSRSTWRWVRASEKPFPLDAGPHQFTFNVLEADLWLDELILSNDPAWVPED